MTLSLVVLGLITVRACLTGGFISYSSLFLAMVSLILFWMVRMWCSALRSPGVFPAIWMPPGGGRAVRYTPVADWTHTHTHTFLKKMQQIIVLLVKLLTSNVNLQPDPEACSLRRWSVCATRTKRSCSAASACSSAECAARTPWMAAGWRWLSRSLLPEPSSLDGTV